MNASTPQLKNFTRTHYPKNFSSYPNYPNFPSFPINPSNFVSYKVDCFCRLSQNCSPTQSTTERSALSKCSGFVPPALANSGFPPPLPPT